MLCKEGGGGVDGGPACFKGGPKKFLFYDRVIFFKIKFYIKEWQKILWGANFFGGGGSKTEQFNNHKKKK